MIIKLKELKELVNKALVKYGYNLEEVTIISDVLMYAQTRGNSQGISKLIGRGIPKGNETSEIKIIKHQL